MKSFRSCLKSLARRFSPMRGKVWVSVLIGMVDVALSLAFVWVSKLTVDIAVGASAEPLSKGVALFAGILVMQIVCRISEKYWEGYIQVGFQNKFRADAFSKVMRSEWNGTDRFHSGDAVNRLEGDIATVSDFLCINFPQCIVTAMQLIAATVFLFFLQPQLGWIVTFIMPVAVVCSRLFFKKMRKLTGEIRAGDSRVQGHMQENIQHRILVRTLMGTASVLEKFGNLQLSVRRLTISRLGYGAIARGFMNLGFSAGYATAFLWGVYGLQDGTVTYGMMVAFLQLVGQVQRPVASLASHIPAFIRTLASEERLMELTDSPQEIEGEPVVFASAPGIRVENLTYSYPGRDEVLFGGLCYDFKPGSMTAILGSTGVGKSTLVKVIMALLTPSSGKVLLYGDGKTVDSGVDTRCNFMYVPQGNSLMSGSIRDNLHLAKPDAGEDELRDALHQAAADFVFNLKDGIDTSCAEVGVGLSEGQAQRIAIARALLRPGGILILDEATSALDASTELELLSRLAEHYRGVKTILCITHRPAATTYADGTIEL